jgi:chromate transporter
MKSGGGVLLTLAGFFALMSLFAIGGANSAVPEIHRFAVNVQDWLSDRQFSESFALAQLTPGPNVILVTLIGYHVAGIVGAVVATLPCAVRPQCWPFWSAPPPTVSGARAGTSRSAVA